METNHSKFWMGLGLGSIIGAVVYKVADGTFNLAEKADEVKNKVHAFADNAKK